MSGHSKWSSIKHKKGAADAKRGKLFSKLAKTITVAVKSGGADESTNFTLRLAIDKARQANMPKDNIIRAISRGSGEGDDGKELKGVVYEAMGPGGASILIEVLTDNTNRSITNVKTIIGKNGGNFDAKVLWQFDRKGVVRIEDISSVGDRDELELTLIDVGVEDLSWENGLELIGELSDLQTIEKSLGDLGLKASEAQPEYVAKESIQLSAEDEEKLMNLMDKLDDDDDVQNVYTNAA
ncbi:YebC/PmpR family DNA-binding transcriptional regulator [Candidatus Uhrbacteria bacterium]|jgi:YebC/PmpR family DNA-binding regulatory protein|nr:YebC/PmpR family DNA-binding transcriptional regulator [Candidatus Uhrbacteria bacterium]